MGGAPDPTVTLRRKLNSADRSGGGPRLEILLQSPIDECNLRAPSLNKFVLRGAGGNASHGAKESDCGRAAGRDSLQTPLGPDFRHVTLMEPSLVADVGPTVRWAARGVAL